MHQIFTHMYSTVSVGPSYMENPIGLLQAPSSQLTFPYISHWRYVTLFTSLQPSKSLKSKLMSSPPRKRSQIAGLRLWLPIN